MATPRRPQQRWLDAAAEREARRAAFFARPDDVVATDLARLDRLLLVQSSWRVARTMPENPHAYTTRATWLWPGGDDDFRWCVETIRLIGQPEKYPPGPRGRYYQVLHRADRQHWTMGWHVGATQLINRKPTLPGDL